MTNNKTIKYSIARRLISSMSLLVALIILGGIGLYGTEQWVRQDYEHKLTVYERKTDLANQIQQHFNGSVTELRGYMAMRLFEFKTKLDTEHKALDDAIIAFKNVEGLTPEDREYLGTVQVSETKFFSDNVPTAYKLVANNDTDGMISYGRDQGYVQFTDSIRQSNIKYVGELNKETASVSAEYNTLLTRLFVGFSIYLVLVGALIFAFAMRLAKDIGRPLQEMARSSRDSSSDQIMQLTYDEREDEIGFLTQSLKIMLSQIRQNEKRMMEANEELQAQQEELISQQDELYTTLMKVQENESILEAQNLLNTSLVNTLDRDELLHSIIKNVREIMHSDKGAIVLLQEDLPHATVGIKDSRMKAFLTMMEDSVLVRLREDRKIFTTTREAQDMDKGYHEEKIVIYDLCVPILSHKADIVAVMILTRQSRAFSPEDIAQAQALANQISLSIERLHTYEASERDRLLNQEIIDSIREGIQVFDEHGLLVQMNQTWRKWVRAETSAANESNERLFELIVANVEEPQELIYFIQDALAGTTSEDAKLIYTLRGEEQKILQVYFEKISDRGMARRTVLVHRDITREYEVDQMKSEFVSTVSHELRTPLSSVLGFTELMLNKDLQPERQIKYLNTIHREAKRLTELINDFLDIQRMEAGKQVYEMSTIDLIPVAIEVLEGFYMHSNKHQIRVETQMEHAYYYGDESKLRQVFMNMIGNAMKYSPNGGDVLLRFGQAEDELTVDIVDHGLGIPKDAIGHLFSKFYRIDNSDRRKIGGTGLGLAICKEIMKAHNGTITVESVLGEGSTFTLHFPINVQMSANGEPMGMAEVAVSTDEIVTEMKEERPRLLIVEDDNSLAMLLKEELKESGFLVAHLMDGEAAVRVIREQLPDAIVLDIMLKDSISGWDVIEAMKKDERTSSIPIFISSALDEKERGLSLGASEYLTKPYQPSKLSNLILQTLLRNEKNGVIMVPEQNLDWEL
ncbi:MAG: ATP-binding protein [Tumebacillaceae bacterium]